MCSNMAALTLLHTVHKYWFIFVSFLRLYVLSTAAFILQSFQTHRSFDLHSADNCEGIVAVITGAERGIGYQVAKELLKLGCHVIIASRMTELTDSALQSLHSEVPGAKVEHIPLDLSSLTSVRGFVEKFKKKELPLHLLINNAGVMLLSSQPTTDGYDYTFSVNYLSHFLLSLLLLDVMIMSSKKNRSARIVNLSSCVHHIGIFANCDEIQGRPFYSSHMAYARSKLAVVMSTYELNRRLSLAACLSGERSTVTVNAVHPGIINSDLFRNMHWSWAWLQRLLAGTLLKTTRQGADSVLYAALSRDLESRGGLYISNCKPTSSASASYDSKIQSRLWCESLQLVGLKESDVFSQSDGK